jgi:2-polyprenyl-6-methoxyphenol hydroxylase-like FAD-dependent oxidoreductase
LLDFVEEDEDDEHGRKIVAHLVDELTGQRYSVRTKYLFGADGGRSTVANILGLPFTDLPGGGFAYNVLFRADLTHLMKHREGNLHMIMRLDKDFPFVCMLRQVQPATEWMLVIMPKGPDAPNPKRSFEDWAAIAKDHIGDDSVDVEVLDVSGVEDQRDECGCYQQGQRVST